MLKRSLSFLFLAGLALPAWANEEAESGPRAERVVVVKADGSRTEVAPPAPVPVKIRARPSPAEIARATEAARLAAAAAKPPKAKPLVVVTPRLVPPAPTVAAVPTLVPRVLGAPVAPPPPAAGLTRRDHESLRWLTRLRAKYPERYTQELVKNARARELIFAASKLPEAEQEKIFRPAVDDDGEDEDHGGAAPDRAVEPEDEEEAEY